MSSWLQVAEAASQHSSPASEDSGKHEAAVYAALSGYLNRILPVCHTRADILWAYTRSWLETQVDRSLAVKGNASELTAGLRLGQDAVAVTKRDHPEEVHCIVLDDVEAFWPPDRCGLTNNCLLVCWLSPWLDILPSCVVACCKNTRLAWLLLDRTLLQCVQGMLHTSFMTAICWCLKC